MLGAIVVSVGWRDMNVANIAKGKGVVAQTEGVERAEIRPKGRAQSP